MPRVLVVDDDPMIRRLVNVKLTRCGYDVTEAADGDEAVRVALRERPEAVLVDSVMPGRSGESVCSELKEAYGPVVFVLTGHPPAPTTGPNAPDLYLQKPFSPSDLAERLASALAQGAGAGVAGSPES